MAQQRKGIEVVVTGIKSTSSFINARNLLIDKAIENQLIKSTTELKEEVKSSIQGSRAEPRSVDTGDFLKSIESKSDKNTGRVSSDVKQSIFMEFGTTKIPERRHFRNSLNRKKKKIEDDIASAIGNII